MKSLGSRTQTPVGSRCTREGEEVTKSHLSNKSLP